ncbi:STAS domain-containing protein [Rugosimonospora africana]|nr:STAS domain-containing protein [Rugosimonospora africana]
MNLLYKVDRTGGRLSVRLAGGLDLSTVDELGEVLAAAIGQPDTVTVEVDLGEVNYIDSTSIGTLVAAFRAANHVGCVLHVSHARGMVQEVLDVVGVLEPLTTNTGRRGAAEKRAGNACR